MLSRLKSGFSCCLRGLSLHSGNYGRNAVDGGCSVSLGPYVKTTGNRNPQLMAKDVARMRNNLLLNYKDLGVVCYGIELSLY